MNKKLLVVLENKRTSDFSMKYDCHYCDNFSSQVIVLPDNDKQPLLFICKGCLETLSEALNENMRSKFKQGFEKRQKEDKNV